MGRDLIRWTQRIDQVTYLLLIEEIEWPGSSKADADQYPGMAKKP
jgi:hypothetical protein